MRLRELQHKLGAVIQFALDCDGAAKAFNLHFNHKQAHPFAFNTGIKPFIQAKQLAAIPGSVNAPAIIPVINAYFTVMNLCANGYHRLHAGVAVLDAIKY